MDYATVYVQKRTKPGRIRSRLPFPALFDGHEPEELQNARFQLYSQTWDRRRERIDEVVRASSRQVVDQIDAFIEKPWKAESEDGRLNTALVVALGGASNGAVAQVRMLEQVYERLRVQEHTFVVTLVADQCVTLKSALKRLVARMLAEIGHVTGVAVPTPENLNYDLETLVDWAQFYTAESRPGLESIEDLRLVVIVQDASGFDATVLNSLIGHLAAYNSRLPLVLITTCSSSLAVLDQRLSRQVMQRLDCTVLEQQHSQSTTSTVDNLLEAVLEAEPALLVDAELVEFVSRESQVRGVEYAASALQYAYMAHFYGQPLSVLVEPETATLASSEHVRVLRGLSSFQQTVEREMEAGHTQMAGRILKDDEFVLSDLVPNARESVRPYLQDLKVCTEMIGSLQDLLQVPSRLAFKDVYLLAQSGGAGSDELLGGLLMRLQNTTAEIKSKAASIVAQVSGTDPGSSEEDVSQTAAKLLMTRLIPYTQLDVYEVFLVGDASLQEQVLSPHYRQNLETTMFEPEAYLEGARDDAKAPYVSVMYRLYCEAEASMNIYDFYQVFREACGFEPKPALALFLQGLAELKMMGLVKEASKKSANTSAVEKVLWRS